MKIINKIVVSVLIAICFVGCIALTACDKEKLTSLTSDGIVVQGGAFEQGSKLVTDIIEPTDEEWHSVVALLEGKEYDRAGKVSIIDISIVKDGKKVQPDQKVKVTIPAPFDSKSGYVVFHIKDDDSVQELSTTYADGNISFETDSFSYFVVAEVKTEINNPPSVVTALRLDSEIAGFVDGNAVYQIGREDKPDPYKVIVKGVTASGEQTLTQDQYTVDLGGLDFTAEGTYTITYTYNKDASVKATLTIKVVSADSINLTLSGSSSRSAYYTGGCAIRIARSEILNNGEPCDLDALGLSWEWRDLSGAVVNAVYDTTWDDETLFPTPAKAGTYKFVIYS